MEKKLFCLFLFVAFLATGTLFAQNMSVRGKVVDENGEPLIGASVLVKGTQNGQITNLEGVFSFANLKKTDVLVISFVGMQKTEAAVKPQMTITLRTDAEQLDEVLVVAFGEQKRSSFTGSASVIKSEALEKKQVTNVISGLQGQVAGLQMVQSSGAPNATPTLRIRGFSSINAGSDPLIIVDGAPYDGGWNNLNPNDVENVTVLKDAASNALYGARGANGVVMITTKKGKAGKATITLDSKWGANSNAQVEYDFIKDPRAYYEMHYKALYNHYVRDNGESALFAHLLANATLYESSATGGLGYIGYSVPKGEYLIGTNGKMNPNATLGNRYYHDGQVYTIIPESWKEATFRTGLRQEYNLNLTGGDEKFTFYTSLGYLKNEGVVHNSDYDRYTARLKADYQARPWLRLGGNVNYSHSTANDISEGSTTLFDQIMTMAPIYPIFVRDGDGNILTDENGPLYDYGAGNNAGLQRPQLPQVNFLQENKLNTQRRVTNLMGLTGYVDITPIEGLKITLNGTVNNNENHYTYAQQSFYGFGAQNYKGGYIYKENNQYYSVNFQQIINYTRSFGKHNMSLMVGHENYNYETQSLGGDRNNMFSFFQSQDLNSAITFLSNYSSSSKYNTEGFFFRGMYNYDERYFFSASYRRDASSRFHPDHRWGNFYSIGGAWIMTKEDWLSADWLNMLKLKASWGQQGNDAIGDFRYTDTYEVSNTGGELGFVQATVGNPKITWETNSNYNAGFEFELFKSRLTGSVEYFYRKTTDMLSYVLMPFSAGYGGSYDNVGDMSNKGIEIDLNWNIFRQKNFSWSVNLNATHYVNKVLKLNEDNRGNILDGHAGYANGNHFVGEGLPLYTWMLRRFAGVNEEGQALYYVQKDGKLETTTSYTAASYFNCGDPHPDLYGGFGTTLSFMGFDFSIGLNYSIGGKAFDYGYQSLMGNPQMGMTGGSYHKDLLNAWSEENRNSNIPRFQLASQGNDLSASYTSDRFLTDASSLTLHNVNIGYTLPRQLTNKAGLGKVRIYASGENLYYWSKRKGFDPRNSFSGEASATTYAPIRTISGGINIQF